MIERRARFPFPSMALKPARAGSPVVDDPDTLHTQQCRPDSPGAATGFSMSTSTPVQNHKKKPQPSKETHPIKAAPKPQPTGLTREELRQIVLEMIG